MTFIISLQGQSSIWLCADRRLTYPGNRFVDTGVKISEISGTDGHAFLGYAGLGASIAGTQPSAWMNDLLKNIGLVTIHQQLEIIADAMRTSLPRHLATMKGEQSHILIATALINGVVNLYQLSVANQFGLSPKLIFTRHENSSGKSPPFAMTGSGANYLNLRKSQRYRDLLRVLKAVEAGRVNPRAIADKLAVINQSVAVQDPMVSQKCIVKWFADSGGYQFYDGTTRVEPDAAIPSVGNGMDTNDIVRAMLPLWHTSFDDFKAGGTGAIDAAEAQAAINREHGRKPRRL